jgi:uncharacterized protein (TIGR00255 family)
LRERVDACAAALGTRVDGEQLARELALVLARADVSEELARARAHLVQAREVIAAEAGPGQGKTLDFLAQELVRELTTAGSKVADHEGARSVIAAKGTIERIREQVQNVE